MIRGWRNDPRWIEHYRLRDERSAQRQIERINMESQMIQTQRDLERSFERLRRPSLTMTTDWV